MRYRNDSLPYLRCLRLKQEANEQKYYDLTEYNRHTRIQALDIAVLHTNNPIELLANTIFHMQVLGKDLFHSCGLMFRLYDFTNDMTILNQINRFTTYRYEYEYPLMIPVYCNWQLKVNPSQEINMVLLIRGAQERPT